MINQVNLKDEKYLQEYEAQVSKLPLEELYEIMDMIQKDPSPERIHIVEARIRYLEEHPNEKPEGLFPDLEENAEDSIKTSDCITCPKCLGQKKETGMAIRQMQEMRWKRVHPNGNLPRLSWGRQSIRPNHL